MADKVTEKIAEESYKEGIAAAKSGAELRTTKKENETLARVNAQLQRGYKRALEAPNKIQIGITVAAGAVGAGLGFQANKLLEKKTETWVAEGTGEKTMIGRVVQHGVVPLAGIALAVGGAFVQSGPASAALMGFGGGMMAGSIVRSALAA